MVLSSTPSDIPSEAMMNANSPIWVRENPDSMAMRNGWPVMSIPNVPNTIIPTMTTADSNSIGDRYSTIMLRSTIMPTDMKNTAPKRSLIGATTLSMRSA